MLQTIKHILKRSDYFMLLVLAVLCAISFTAIYSGVYDISAQKVLSHPYRQLKFYIIGLFLFYAIPVIGYKRITNMAYPLYVLGCLVLIMVLFKGIVENGAKRWIMIGSFKGQPSEFFKLIWVVFLGKIFSDLKAEPIGFSKLLTKLFWLIPPTLLVFMQPDLGTAFSYVCIWGFVIVFLGLKRKIIIVAALIAVVSLPVMWGQLKDYQRMRVIAFINPEKYADSSGYQPIQSKIAIGSGGISGKGYLKGTQSHLRFMPERHTDFIYSVICEEFGLIGALTILVTFFLLIARIAGIASQIKEASGKVMCVAIAGAVFIQFYANVSMTVGIAPVVGIPLPFISYGGSSLLTFMAMMGFYNSVYISRYNKNV